MEPLPAELEHALRAELRPDERVVFAAVPLGAPDAGDLTARLRLRLVPAALGLAALILVGQIALIVAGEYDLPPAATAVLVPSALLLVMSAEFRRIRAARRTAAGSVLAVTDQRAIILATVPIRSIRSIEAREIDEVYRWTVSPACGHVRFRSATRADEVNALMFVPDPRACEAAMRALVSTR